MAAALLALLAAPALAALSPSPHLAFDRAPEEIAAHCAQVKARAQMRLEGIASRSAASRTFADTPAALDDALWTARDETASDRFLRYASTSTAVRDAASDCQSLIKKLLIDTYARPDLYRGLTDYAARKPAPAGEDARLLEKELLDFKRSGAALPADKRKKLAFDRRWIADLEADFVKNVEDDKSFVLLSSAELAGLPDDWTARLPRQGAQYELELRPSLFGLFMSQARDEAARRRVETAFANRAVVPNLPLLVRLLDLRRDAARLLGYPSHAAYVLEDRMAKDPATVERFLSDLARRLRPAAKAELAELVRLKDAELGKASDHVVRAWDFRYYDARRLAESAVDEDEVREYFPLETVVAGMLRVYEKLLGVRFKRIADPAPEALWAPDVELYEVDDAGTGRTLAYFYLDLFSREGKYPGSQSEDVIDGRRLSDGSYEKPVAVLMTNLPKPQPGRPTLLRHGRLGDLETLFHEFGHVMHMTLTKAQYGRFSGTNVAADFVEAPSQMMENWTWDPATLAALSGRYDEPEKKLPEDLLQRLIASRRVDAALKTLQQVAVSEIDLAYHGEGRVKDPTKVWRRVHDKLSLIPFTPGTHPEAAFDHLQDGYDAAYYGYLWSQVYADDMFSRFQASGLLDPIMGLRLRTEILERGASRDEAASLRSFLGREPSDAAFLKTLSGER